MQRIQKNKRWNFFSAIRFARLFCFHVGERRREKWDLNRFWEENIIYDHFERERLDWMKNHSLRHCTCWKLHRETMIMIYYWRIWRKLDWVIGERWWTSNGGGSIAATNFDRLWLHSEIEFKGTIPMRSFHPLECNSSSDTWTDCNCTSKLQNVKCEMSKKEIFQLYEIVCVSHSGTWEG